MDCARSFFLFLALTCVASAATLYQGATILTLAEGDNRVLAPGFLLVDDAGTIKAVGPGDGRDEPLVLAAAGNLAQVDLSGRLVLPGFISGHSHLWQSAFRGIAPDQELPGWLKALHSTYGPFVESGDLAAFTRHGALDQLRHGVTTTYNHSHGLGKTFAMYREQFEAELETPQRFVFSWVNEQGASDEVWRERLAPVVAQLKPQADHSFLGLSINAVGVYGGVEALRREISLAKSLGLTVQMHYLEPAATQVADRAKWAQFKQAGAIYYGVSFAHFIHADGPIVREAAAAGAAMIWNPLSNGRLASGLPDIEGYLAAGLKVGMGVDGQASADISDPFENVRLGLYSLRMRRENAGGLQPIDVLRLHTLKTAEVLGVERWVGSLEAGKFADFLVIDPGEPGTGPVWDPAATLVFACSSRNLEAVYVGGRAVVAAGSIQGVDTKTLEGEVRKRIEALRERASHRMP